MKHRQIGMIEFIVILWGNEQTSRGDEGDQFGSFRSTEFFLFRRDTWFIYLELGALAPL